MIAPLSRKERLQLAQEMNAMSQKPSRCGNVKNEVVELISENSSKCKCDEKNSDKDERRARINARRAAMKKQMNKIFENYLGILVESQELQSLKTGAPKRVLVNVMFALLTEMTQLKLKKNWIAMHMEI